MKIMVLGAGGFIGAAIVAELLAHGHGVTAVVRPGSSASLPLEVSLLPIDLAHATDVAVWQEALAGTEVVVNAAGVLRGPDMAAIHIDMPRALIAGAEAAGVRRMILISAISARPDVPTDYAETKLAGEALVRQSGLEWTVLRPSLVYGAGSYGGTSLLRGLAALPGLVPLAGTGNQVFAPIHLSDLARAVRQCCELPSLAGRELEPCGPDLLTLRDLLTHYRRWLGLGEPRFLMVPIPVMRLLGRMGDLTGNGPVSTNSLVQLLAGNAGDGIAFARTIGFAPRSLTAALRDSPAQVQDRWHARLYFLAPAIRWVLVLLWLASALIGLMWGAEAARDVAAGLALPRTLAAPLQWTGSLIDLAVAAVVLKDHRGKWATTLQLLVVAGYTLVIGLATPAAWREPLGGLIKNLPILALILVYGSIAERR